jgi:hypothetical protein
MLFFGLINFGNITNNSLEEHSVSILEVADQEGC